MIIILSCGDLNFAVDADTFAVLNQSVMDCVGSPDAGMILFYQYTFHGQQLSIRCENSFATYIRLFKEKSDGTAPKLNVVQHAPVVIPKFSEMPSSATASRDTSRPTSVMGDYRRAATQQHSVDNSPQLPTTSRTPNAEPIREAEEVKENQVSHRLPEEIQREPSAATDQAQKEASEEQPAAPLAALRKSQRPVSATTRSSASHVGDPSLRSRAIQHALVELERLERSGVMSQLNDHASPLRRTPVPRLKQDDDDLHTALAAGNQRLERQEEPTKKKASLPTPGETSRAASSCSSSAMRHHHQATHADSVPMSHGSGCDPTTEPVSRNVSNQRHETSRPSSRAMSSRPTSSLMLDGQREDNQQQQQPTHSSLHNHLASSVPSQYKDTAEEQAIRRQLPADDESAENDVMARVRCGEYCSDPFRVTLFDTLAKFRKAVLSAEPVKDARLENPVQFSSVHLCFVCDGCSDAEVDLDEDSDMELIVAVRRKYGPRGVTLFVQPAASASMPMPDREVSRSPMPSRAADTTIKPSANTVYPRPQSAHPTTSSSRTAASSNAGCAKRHQEEHSAATPQPPSCDHQATMTNTSTRRPASAAFSYRKPRPPLEDATQYLSNRAAGTSMSTATTYGQSRGLPPSAIDPEYLMKFSREQRAEALSRAPPPVPID